MPVFLLSGGLDSVVLLHWGVKQPYLFGVDPDEEFGDRFRNVAVFFRTGLKVDDRMAEICRRHCEALQVELVEIDLSHVWNPGRRAKGEAPADRESPVPIAERTANDSFWSDEFDFQDGRSMLFLTYCGIVATNRGLNSVLVAFQHETDEHPKYSETDDSMVSDVGAPFLKQFEALVDRGGFLASRAPFFHAPFDQNGMAKRHIVLLGWELGVDLDDTLSCEFSDPPCNNCTGCVRRARAFEQARHLRRIRKTYDVHADVSHFSGAL
jgi:7-cyano-7-deazaguanine synthase in queuosine biosynthesis